MTIPTELSEFLALDSKARRRGSKYSVEEQLEADTAYYEALSYEPLQKYRPLTSPGEEARDDYFNWKRGNRSNNPNTFAEWLVADQEDLRRCHAIRA